MQRLADRGIKEEKWVRDVEGVYMRLDIPLIMPHLLKQLEDRKQGKEQQRQQFSCCMLPMMLSMP